MTLADWFVCQVAYSQRATGKLRRFFTWNWWYGYLKMCKRLNKDLSPSWWHTQFHEIGLKAASHQFLPSQMGTYKWPANKNLHTKELLPYCSQDSCIPGEKPPNKGNMVEGKAMTALSHPSLPLTQHTSITASLPWIQEALWMPFFTGP